MVEVKLLHFFIDIIPLTKPLLTREGILGHEFDKGEDSSLLNRAIHSLFY
jgi:hypothetical protein